MNTPDTTPILCPTTADAYEELLLQWSDEAFFGDDEEDSLAAVYAEEIGR